MSFSKPVGGLVGWFVLLYFVCVVLLLFFGFVLFFPFSVDINSGKIYAFQYLLVPDLLKSL